MVPDAAGVTTTWLYQQLMALRGHFNSIAQGAAQQNISKEKVAETKVIVPPRRLIAAFDREARPIWDLIRALTSIRANLRVTRDLLLPRLISGEIDVTDLDVAVPEAAA